jgi:hypothetical protein
MLTGFVTDNHMAKVLRKSFFKMHYFFIIVSDGQCPLLSVLQPLQPLQPPQEPLFFGLTTDFIMSNIPPKTTIPTIIVPIFSII